MKSTFNYLVTAFFTSYLTKERGLSENTIASYSDGIRLLLLHACDHFAIKPEQIEIKHISFEMIIDFLDHIEKNRGNCAATRNQRLAAFKAFFQFVARREPEMTHMNERVHAIKPKKHNTSPPPSLTVEEVRAILDETDCDTLIGLRDKVIIQLLYNTGARVQEIADLKISDLELGKRPVATLTGKGGKTRIIPIMRETAELVAEYLEFRKHKGVSSDFLIVNIRDQAMTRFGIEKRIDIHAKAAADKCPSLKGRKITPHVFRHTTALHLIESKNDITIVKEWLGHADLKTTSQYIEVSIERKQRALEKMRSPVATSKCQHQRPNWRQPSILEYLSGISNQARYVARKTQKTLQLEQAPNALAT